MENIIFEDNHLLIVSKKPTVPVQSDISGDKCLLEFSKEYLKKKYKKRRYFKEFFKKKFKKK